MSCTEPGGECITGLLGCDCGRAGEERMNKARFTGGNMNDEAPRVGDEIAVTRRGIVTSVPSSSGRHLSYRGWGYLSYRGLKDDRETWTTPWPPEEGEAEVQVTKRAEDEVTKLARVLYAASKWGRHSWERENDSIRDRYRDMATAAIRYRTDER